MESDIATCEIENEEQFWSELLTLLGTPCDSAEATDDCLRSYLAYGVKYKDNYLQTDEDLARFAYNLRAATVFIQQDDYVRRQFVYGLLQEDEIATLHIFAVVLLYDGRDNEPTFEMMKSEGAFPRLVELIQQFSEDEQYESLHRLLLHLLYEMARILTLEWQDLATIDDAFILSLFSLIEATSSDPSDPYHYTIIRVLLVINEQYMVASSLPPPILGGRPQAPLTNRVLKAISTHAAIYKTFGENLVFLMNRETEAILLIQILKLLYIVFGNRNTAEYFYTNDLHVVVDVVLRNLRNLPADDDYAHPHDGSPAMTQALRHTYLRVLHHLLENSQLRRPGMDYKRDEILTTLDILGGRRWGGALHFAPLDETTLRLAQRCRAVSWLKDPDSDEKPLTNGHAPGQGHIELARRSLGMTVQEAGESMLEVAQQTERPGVIVPTRDSSRDADGLPAD